LGKKKEAKIMRTTPSPTPPPQCSSEATIDLGVFESTMDLTKCDFGIYQYQGSLTCLDGQSYPAPVSKGGYAPVPGPPAPPRPQKSWFSGAKLRHGSKVNLACAGLQNITACVDDEQCVWCGGNVLYTKCRARTDADVSKCAKKEDRKSCGVHMKKEECVEDKCNWCGGNVFHEKCREVKDDEDGNCLHLNHAAECEKKKEQQDCLEKKGHCVWCAGNYFNSKCRRPVDANSKMLCEQPTTKLPHPSARTCGDWKDIESCLSNKTKGSCVWCSGNHRYDKCRDISMADSRSECSKPKVNHDNDGYGDAPAPAPAPERDDSKDVTEKDYEEKASTTDCEAATLTSKTSCLKKKSCVWCSGNWMLAKCRVTADASKQHLCTKPEN